MSKFILPGALIKMAQNSTASVLFIAKNNKNRKIDDNRKSKRDTIDSGDQNDNSLEDHSELLPF